MFYAIYKVLRSFIFAFAGITKAFTERNMRVHGITAVVVVVLGMAVGLSQMEWLWVMLMIGAVFSVEIINTAIEDVCNVMRDTLGAPYKATKHARDMAAGAVLVLAIVAALGGLVIFGPKLWVVLG